MYTRIALRRKGETGLSLIELLVVLGIIAVITGVSVPVLVRYGLFTSNKAQLAAREVFTVLRAAKIYATTYNVETAVAYGGLLVEDSFSGAIVPVVDSVAVVRRLTRKEFLLHRDDDNPGDNVITTLISEGFSPTNLPFIPLRARDGGFKELPNDTCILPDIFEISGEGETLTGLKEIQLWNIDDALPIEPRLDYDLNGDSIQEEYVFPAHVFSTEGGLIAPEGAQRLGFRVGIIPDAELEDRFFRDASEGVPDGVDIFFNELTTVAILKDPDEIQDVNIPQQVRNASPIDIDLEILLYVATGRVKVGS